MFGGSDTHQHKILVGSHVYFVLSLSFVDHWSLCPIHTNAKYLITVRQHKETPMITDVFTQREAQNVGTGHRERHGERHGEKGSETLQAQRLFLLCFQLHSLRGVMLLCKAEPSSVVGANGAERLHVGLASAHGATHITCITCDQVYTKGGAFKHFTRKKHGLDPDVVKRWAVCTDRHSAAQQETPENEA